VLHPVEQPLADGRDRRVRRLDVPGHLTSVVPEHNPGGTDRVHRHMARYRPPSRESTHLPVHERVRAVNLATNLTRTATRYAERPAVRLDDTVLTYADLDRRSAHAAGLLRGHGIGPGDRVAVMLPNLPEFAVVYYGILRAGAVVVPVNPLLKRREVAYYLDDSGARLLVAWSGCADEAQAGAAQAGTAHVTVDGGFADRLAAAGADWTVAGREGTDTAVILYTSSTTGQPKGAELTHANLA